MPDIYDVVLFFSNVLDPFELGDVKFGKFVVESQIFIEFNYCGQDCVPVFELSIGKFGFDVFAPSVKYLVDPALFLKFGPVGMELLLEGGLFAQFLA